MPAHRPVPAETAWRRSRYCVGQSHCLEVAVIDHGVAVRNSTSPETVLVFGGAQWRHFMAGIKAGQLITARVPGAAVRL